MNKFHAVFRNNEGFTFFEAAIAVLALGIIIVAAKPNLSHARAKASVAWALDQTRDLQKPALFYFLDNGVAPDIQTLNALYSDRDASKSVIGKFRIIRVNDARSKPARPDKNGNLPSHYIICSTLLLTDAAYVYSYDDLQPLVAPVGTDPVGVGGCGAASETMPSN